LADVFISYAREDRDRIDRLAKLFEAEGHSCWFDQHISGGERFVERTSRELAEARAVVVAWTQHSIASHWVADEASEARDRGKLAPVSLDGSVPPLGFRQFQCVDFSMWSGNRDKAFFELLSAVRRLLAEGNLPPQAASQKSFPKKIFTAVAAIAFIAVAIVAAKIFPANKAHTQRIAVFSLAAPEGDPELSALASGIADDITAQISPSGVDVVARSETANAANYRETARRLNASLAVEGAVVRDGGEWKADVSVFSPATGRILMTQRFREKDASLLRLRAGTSTADALTGAAFALRGANKAVSTSGLGLLLRAAAAEQAGDPLAVRDLYAQLVKEDPGLAIGHVGLAIAAAFSLNSAPASQQEALRKQAKDAAARALEIDPRATDAFMALVNLEPRDAFAARESHLVEGLRRNDTNSSLLATYADLLSEVGRLDEALSNFKRSAALDPVSVFKAQALAMAEFNVGEIASARRRIESLSDAWPEDTSVSTTRLWIALFGGNEDEALSMIETPQPPGGSSVFGSSTPEKLACWKTAVTALKSGAESVRLDGAKSIAECRSRNLLPGNTSLMLLAALGDIDDAFIAAQDQLVAGKLRYDILYSSATAAMRVDPRFAALAKDAGLVVYWRSSGYLPDFCKTARDGICSAAAGAE